MKVKELQEIEKKAEAGTAELSDALRVICAAFTSQATHNRAITDNQKIIIQQEKVVIENQEKILSALEAIKKALNPMWQLNFEEMELPEAK